MKTYKKQYTKEISFPIGGIGTGSIGFGGNGRLHDWEIFNRPAKGSLNGYSHFAVRVFHPNGEVDARVRLSAHNPFIPMDEDASSIPTAFFEVEMENISAETLTFSAALSVYRPYRGQNTAIAVGEYPAVFMGGEADPASPDYRDMTLCCLAPDATVQPCWYRGTWQDPIAIFWREFSEGKTLSARTYAEAADQDTATLDPPAPCSRRKESSAFFAFLECPQPYQRLVARPG